jgi:hypothetical protein
MIREAVGAIGKPHEPTSMQRTRSFLPILHRLSNNDLFSDQTKHQLLFHRNHVIASVFDWSVQKSTIQNFVPQKSEIVLQLDFCLVLSMSLRTRIMDFSEYMQNKHSIISSGDLLRFIIYGMASVKSVVRIANTFIELELELQEINALDNPLSDRGSNISRWRGLFWTKAAARNKMTYTKS